MNLSSAEWFVNEFESFSPDDWKRMEAHPKWGSAAPGRKMGPFMLEYFRAKCMTDFYEYFYNFLNFDQRKHYYPPVHGPDGLAGFLQDRTIDKYGERTHVSLRCVVATRYARKTHMTLAYFVWKFIRDTNERLLIRAFNQEKVNEIVLPMVAIIESTRHQHAFPWVRPKAKKNGVAVQWSPKEGRFLLDRTDIVRTPSVEACGSNMSPTGGHFGNGYYDDIETGENTGSELMREQMWDLWRDDKPLFGAASDVVLVGTPWHKDGLINAAINGWREFEKIDYGLWLLPGTYQAFDTTFHGAKARIGEQRDCVATEEGFFPVDGDGLKGVRCKITFKHPVRRDTCEEMREIVSNDRTTFQVNRPFPAMLGEPLQWFVDNRKCSLPTIHTMDSVDEPPSKNPNVLPRVSLWLKRQEMGSHKYAKQVELSVKDANTMMLNSDLIKRIDIGDVPTTEVNRFRSFDLASSSRTTASTASCDGVHHHTGIYITRLTHEPTIKIPNTMLDIFTTYIRSQEEGKPVVTHFFEEAMMEKAMRDFFPAAEQNPYEWFSAMGAEFQEPARMYFKNKGSIYIPKKGLSRGKNRESKGQRFLNIQPWLERGQVFIVKDLMHAETLFSQMDDLKVPVPPTMTVDLLDCFVDIIREGFPQRSAEQPKAKTFMQIRGAGRTRRIGNKQGSAMGW